MVQGAALSERVSTYSKHGIPRATIQAMQTSASITVEIHRGTIDPAGEFEWSAGYVEACQDYVLESVREAFPGADVRAVGNGGRTSGTDAEGRDITSDVRTAVALAFDEWCEFGTAEYGMVGR